MNWTSGLLESVVNFYKNLSFHSNLRMCFICTWDYAILFLMMIENLHVSDITSSFLFLILCICVFYFIKLMGESALSFVLFRLSSPLGFKNSCDYWTSSLS